MRLPMRAHAWHHACWHNRTRDARLVSGLGRWSVARSCRTDRDGTHGCRCTAQDDMCKYGDLEYCKTDLISAKGVIFCKFNRASSALAVLEDITARGTVGVQRLSLWV